MPSLVNTIRARRRSRAKATRLGILAKITVWLLSSLGIGVMLFLFIGGILYSDIIENLPPVETVQDWYPVGQDRFPPPVWVFDRSGENILATLNHPSTDDRQWLKIGSALSPSIPDDFINAVIVLQDETFWKHSGFDTRKFLGGVVDSIFGADETEIYRSIPQRLVYMTILPAEDFSDPQITRYLRSAVLAQNLVESFSKEQILEWYLNSVRFGDLTQGIDAAALVFFDKHAFNLSLAESAVLASLLDQSELDPYHNIALVKEKQGSILAKMVNSGMVTTTEFYDSLDEALHFAEKSPLGEIGLAAYTEDRMLDAIGSVLFQRLGLEIRTSIINELQDEVVCTTQFYLDRLSGSSAVIDADGIVISECDAASKIPPLRPGDLGVDHLVDDSALIAVDPTTGEILALYGDVTSERSPGRMTYPLLYLSAFSRGYAPGSMILDIPLPDAMREDANEDQRVGMGPLRMRNALVGGYSYAAERTLGLLGEDAFLNLVHQLGIRSRSDVNRDFDDGIENLLSASLLDLGYAYTAFANLGRMAGEIIPSPNTPNSLSPILITNINDSSGIALHAPTQTSQSILSPPLAYLMVDVLSDSSVRWPIYGRPNIYDLEFPVAVMTEGEGDLIYDSWTIGFTPSLVLGVWLGNADGREIYRMNSENGAASLWHALSEYASSFSSAEGWDSPAEIIELQVCDPSGQLPTEHCPYAVRELFIQGTEPFQYDTFYVPIQINKESGHLATMVTPLDLIEERVFFIPPLEANDWVGSQGFDRPPIEYDTMRTIEPVDPDTSIESPSMFSYVHGKVRVRGRAISDQFDFYRLQYGKGLNPTRWILIGEDHYEPKVRGLLTTWETEGLAGLYTLQLLLVDREGRLRTDFVHVTIDNEPPSIEFDHIPEEILLSRGELAEVLLIAHAKDNLSIEKVEFIVDNRVVSVIEYEPFVTTITFSDEGEYEVSVQASDLAGNVGESEIYVLKIVGE